MARFSITLPDTLHESLTSLAQKNKKTLSQTIRELIESGLEIERLSNDLMENNKHGFEQAFTPEKEKILWKHLLSWSLESRTSGEDGVRVILQHKEVTRLEKALKLSIYHAFHKHAITRSYI